MTRKRTGADPIIVVSQGPHPVLPCELAARYPSIRSRRNNRKINVASEITEGHLQVRTGQEQVRRSTEQLVEARTAMAAAGIA